MQVGVDSRLAVDGGEPVRTRPWPTYDKGDVFVSEEDQEAGRRAGCMLSLRVAPGSLLSMVKQALLGLGG